MSNTISSLFGPFLKKIIIFLNLSSFFDVHLCLPVGVRKKFFRGEKRHFVYQFQLLMMQHKLTYTKRFTLSAP